MKSKLILLTILSFLSFQLFSQIYDPVSWSVEKKVTGKTTADLIIKATIEKGWHLYGLNIPPDGPIATRISVENLENAKKEGTLQAKSKLIEAFDPNFDMKLNWYANEAVFVQKVSSPDPNAIYAKVLVNFMVCNDESCLPPTEEELEVGKPGIKVSEVKEETPLTASAVAGIDSVLKPDSALLVPPALSDSTAKADLWTPVISCELLAKTRAVEECHRSGGFLSWGCSADL